MILLCRISDAPSACTVRSSKCMFGCDVIGVNCSRLLWTHLLYYVHSTLLRTLEKEKTEEQAADFSYMHAHCRHDIPAKPILDPLDVLRRYEHVLTSPVSDGMLSCIPFIRTKSIHTSPRTYVVANILTSYAIDVNHPTRTLSHSIL